MIGVDSEMAHVVKTTEPSGQLLGTGHTEYTVYRVT